MKTYFEAGKEDSIKKQYKANLHCHTITSDGRATPETVKEEYKKRGYSIVAYTDHEHLFNYKHLCDEDFVAINGYELGITGPKVDTYGPLPSAKQLHINIYSKDPDCDITPFYSDAKDWYRFEDMRHLVKATEPFERKFEPESVNALVARAHELGFLVSLNHPNWSLLTAEDYLAYDGFDFIEVHNTGCVRAGHHRDEAAYNDIMKAGKPIFCVATDDNHNGSGFEGLKTDSFGGWCMIASEKLGYTEITDALEAGDFYASCGPEIYSITLDDSGEESIVKVECSPSVRAYLVTQGRRNARFFNDDGSPFTEASFKLYPQDCRFRIRIEDENGNCAWSQIYDIPEDAPRVKP